jgi:hypothetical protein
VKLNLDMTDKRLVVTRAPEPKLDQHGVQRVNKSSDRPLWSTQVCVFDVDGGEIITITTEGDKPVDLAVDDVVVAYRLEAFPWASNGRSGVSYRAETIERES